MKKMTKSKVKSLRDDLAKKIIKFIKPENMSIAEYVITCNLDDIDPTLDNGSYLHWVMTTIGEDKSTEEKIHRLICKGLKGSYLLDDENVEQMSYFCDALKDIMCRDKDYAKDLFEATMEGYPKGDIFDFVYRLNKAFGFTSMNYFCTL